MDRPFPWLRYVDADDLEEGDFDLSGMKVRDVTGDSLGSIEGVVVDVQNGRPYYLVVDSGGWFKSKDFLLPIGHARLDADRDSLIADVPKERINRFPGFDRDKFEELSEDELRRMNNTICGACSDEVVNYSGQTASSSMWERADYNRPDWWTYDTSQSIESRRRSSGASVTSGAAGFADRASDSATREREAITAQGDVSLHPGGRAQPGDVIGIETGGEETHIGDTTDDENKRRADAEEAVRPRKK